MIEIKGYYFITHPGLSIKDVQRDVRDAVNAGVKLIQYRDKKSQDNDMLREAVKLREICSDSLLIINDRLDIATASSADGIHIGQDDVLCEQAREILGKDKIIGVTVHSLEEAKKAEENGADYIGIGPIYATNTKENLVSPLGPQIIKIIKKECELPVVAIGGITLSNAHEVVNAGCDALCAISEVYTGGDFKSQIQKFQTLFNK